MIWRSTRSGPAFDDVAGRGDDRPAARSRDRGSRDRTVVVGDQYFADVASANLAGAHSIEVETYGRRSFPKAIRFGQRCELALAALLNVRWRRST